VWCFLFEHIVLFCVICVICVLCLTVVPLSPSKNLFAVQTNSNNYAMKVCGGSRIIAPEFLASAVHGGELASFTLLLFTPGDKAFFTQRNVRADLYAIEYIYIYIYIYIFSWRE
jgi:hypothetical protein